MLRAGSRYATQWCRPLGSQTDPLDAGAGGALGANLVGMAVPKGQTAVQQAIDRAGLPGYKVASARTN